MLLVLILVAVMSGLALVVHRFSRLKPCPICVGVSLTWVLLLLVRGFGYPVDPLILGLLLGGSVVGIENLLAKRLTRPKPIGKILLIMTGFWLAYNLIMSDWLMLTIGLLLWFAILITMYQEVFYFRSKNKKEKREIEKQLENCC